MFVNLKIHFKTIVIEMSRRFSHRQMHILSRWIPTRKVNIIWPKNARRVLVKIARNKQSYPLDVFSAQVRPVLFAKNARKMSQNTENPRDVRFANSPQLLSGESVSGVPHTPSDTGLQKLVSSANRSVLLTEGWVEILIFVKCHCGHVSGGEQ